MRIVRVLDASTAAGCKVAFLFHRLSNTPEVYFSEKINNFFAMAGSIICTLRKNGSVLFVSTRGMLPPPTMLAFDNKVAPSMDATASVEISNIMKQKMKTKLPVK